jgi:membrane peptidoglycan carboxypeptidase
MFVREYLEEQYGEKVAAEGGLRITTTLDFELQKRAEEIVNKFALENDKKYHATNASLVAVDAKTGHILVMVGSRDYFDKEIEGNYNIATAKRQPGSSFKPFIYLKAFEKGYRPETVLFDLKTQFSTNCEPTDLDEKEGCYSPSNYDDKFRGPMTLRSALAQSINIPAVKLFYLVGMSDTLELIKKLGITTITDPKKYGLSLVLGGGEVTLLEMVGAYSVFAQNGEKRPTVGILKIEDKKGNIVEEWKDESFTVMEKQPILLLNNVLSDNQARIPAFNPNSPMHFPDRDVAAKTGTTNDYRDTWIVGYTPQVVVGAWAGNNDNSSIDKKVAGYIVAPMWRAFMDELLKTIPDEKFEKPEPEDLSKLPPVLRGVWQGEVTQVNNQEVVSQNPHSILHWINKDNPLSGINKNPWNDPQYTYWEYPIRVWASSHGFNVGNINVFNKSNLTSNKIFFSYPVNGQSFSKKDNITPKISVQTEKETQKIEFSVNGVFVGSSDKSPFTTNIQLSQITDINIGNNTLKTVVTSTDGTQENTSITIKIN